MAELHSQTLASRWAKLPLPSQLANIGSEGSRLVLWIKKGNNEQVERSLARALELVDATLSDPRFGKKREEIEMLKHSIIGITKKNDLGIDPDSILAYFNPFFSMAALK